MHRFSRYEKNSHECELLSESALVVGSMGGIFLAAIDDASCMSVQTSGAPAILVVVIDLFQEFPHTAGGYSHCDHYNCDDRDNDRDRK